MSSVEHLSESGSSGVDAVDDLLDWIKNQKEPLYALLGEYGMGKTTTCKMLARRVLSMIDKGEQWPLPIYHDLRHLDIEDNTVPNLEQILKTVISESIKGGREFIRDLEPKKLIRAFETGQAFPIFDGLDEPGVKLTPSKGAELD